MSDPIDGLPECGQVGENGPGVMEGAQEPTQHGHEHGHEQEPPAVAQAQVEAAAAAAKAVAAEKTLAEAAVHAVAADAQAQAAVREVEVARRDEDLADIRRIYVAIHGIGDQFQYATIQQVARSLGRYCGVTGTVPLGRFHCTSIRDFGFLRLRGPSYPPEFQDVGLAEIYWADIPRVVQKEGYQLEEAKQWASSLVDRIRTRTRSRSNEPGLKALDCETMQQVIGEMIEGVGVLDRIFFLLGKVTRVRFELKKLLDSFLGDVQLVTDFEDQRAKLLERFHQAMSKIHEVNIRREPVADIYLVAHSEGTVVTFLGLLQALREYDPKDPKKKRYGWVTQVRGLMTIGSPIEEHLLLWPELWNPYETPKDPALAGNGSPQPDRPSLRLKWTPAKDKRIRWRNYLDYGDPIAYRLQSTSEWLRKNGWDEVFEFDPAEHEFLFSRYLFPGKAHNDYWEDREVFGHFLETVAGQALPLAAGARPDPADAAPRRANFGEPKSHYLIDVVSRVVPYVIPAMLLFLGVFLLYRGVRGFLDPVEAGNEPVGTVVRNVAGAWALFAGITAGARIPRLTRLLGARLASILMFFLGLLAFGSWFDPEHLQWLENAVRGAVGPLSFGTVGTVDGPTNWGPFLNWPALTATLVLLMVVVRVFAVRFPRWGAKTLIVPGCLMVLGVLACGLYVAWAIACEKIGPVWGVVVGGVAFVYLWWLAVVCFDLLFVWHHYVRGSAWGETAISRLADLCESP